TGKREALTQHSTVIAFVGFRAWLSGIEINWLNPSTAKAWPTLPAAKVVAPCRVPLLPLILSAALFSAGHQPTKPDGGAVQVGVVTVNRALELVVKPTKLETITE